MLSVMLAQPSSGSELSEFMHYQGGQKPGKPGILRDFSEHGKLSDFSGNSVQPQGKIVTNEVFLVRHSNISSECGGDLLYC